MLWAQIDRRAYRQGFRQARSVAHAPVAEDSRANKDAFHPGPRFADTLPRTVAEGKVGELGTA